MSICKMCGKSTDAIVNINFKAVPLCDPCASSIAIQQVRWWAEECTPKAAELGTDKQHTHYANLLEKADAVVEAWRDKCQCDCPAEVFIPMEELSSAIVAANQHNA